MQTVYWSVLLALACGYPIRAEVPVQPNFDASRFAGPWHPIQLVINKKHGINLEPIAGRTAVLKSNGDIDVEVVSLDEGECVRKMTTLLHTDMPGVFTKKRNTIRVVETDYETYHVLHITTKYHKILQLEARRREVSESLKEKFKDLARSLGFPVDQIVDIRQTDRCEL